MCFFIAVGENCYVGLFVAQLMQCNRVSPADVRTVRANPAVSGEANRESEKQRESRPPSNPSSCCHGEVGRERRRQTYERGRWCKHQANSGIPSSGVHISPRPRNHPTHHGTSAVMRFNYCRALCNQLTFTSVTSFTQMHDGYSETRALLLKVELADLIVKRLCRHKNCCWN